jgi:exosortase A-associated hydrolase 2
MYVFHFGGPKKRLFGFHHPPPSDFARHSAIVLCHPLAHEYVNTYRTYKYLAIRLAHAGFDVLRFDYYGTGDSPGEFDEATVEQWLNDIEVAVTEVKLRSEAEHVCLAGLRLGGTLSLLASANLPDIYGLVLWDPVINGSTYLEELRKMHNGKLRSMGIKRHRQKCPQLALELMGFPFTLPLQKELQAINLLLTTGCSISNLLLIETEGNACLRPLTMHLGSLNVHYDFYTVSDVNISKQIAANITVPNRILNVVVAWLERIFS